MNEADYALDLIERLKPSLPMIATPSKVLIANMRRREDNPVKLKPKQRLKIEVCHYAGQGDLIWPKTIKPSENSGILEVDFLDVFDDFA